jgi:CRISPR/Cas system-associated exonuclease Cas4 (RecB family)
MLSEHDVYRWLLEAVKLKTRVSSNSVIHVSEVVGCLRRSYYYRKRFLSISPSNALKLLDDSLHSAFQEVLRREGYEVEYEVGIQLPQFKLVGHIDAYHPEKSILLEFKTTNNIPEQPYETHLRQASIYKELVNAKHCYLIYISRNDGRVRVFKVNNSKGIIKWAVERAKQLNEALIRDEPPNPEGNTCQWCEFRLNCRR